MFKYQSIFGFPGDPGDACSIPGGGTKIPYAMWPGQKIGKKNAKYKKECTYTYIYIYILYICECVCVHVCVCIMESLYRIEVTQHC